MLNLSLLWKISLKGKTHYLFVSYVETVLPEKYKEDFDVSSEGPSSALTSTPAGRMQKADGIGVCKKT